MILNSIDEKKKTQGKENTIEISAENLQHLKGVVGEGQRRPKEPAHQTQKTAESPKVKKLDSDVHYKSLSEFEDDEKPVKHKAHEGCFSGYFKMMHKNIYQDYFLKSNTSFDAFIHQCTFFL